MLAPIALSCSAAEEEAGADPKMLGVIFKVLQQLGPPLLRNWHTAAGDTVFHLAARGACGFQSMNSRHWAHLQRWLSKWPVDERKRYAAIPKQAHNRTAASSAASSAVRPFEISGFSGDNSRFNGQYVEDREQPKREGRPVLPPCEAAHSPPACVCRSAARHASTPGAAVRWCARGTEERVSDAASNSTPPVAPDASWARDRPLLCAVPLVAGNIPRPSARAAPACPST